MANIARMAIDQEHPRLRPVSADVSRPVSTDVGGDVRPDVSADVVSHRQAARLLGVTPRSVARMVAEGRLETVVDEHGRRRVRLDAVLERQQTASAPTSADASAPTSGPTVSTDVRADVSTDVSGRQLQASMLVGVLVVAGAEVERLQAKTVELERQVDELEGRERALVDAGRLVLDGRFRARRRARRELRGLLEP